MLSRRTRIQEKKATKKGMYLILASVALLAVLAVFGVQIIFQSSSFVNQFKKPQIISNDTTPPGPPQIDPVPSAYTKDSPLTLNGRAEVNSTVHIYVNNQLVKDVPLSDSSRFTFDVTLQQGPNKLYLTATDPAGNTSPPSAVYDITYFNTAPTLEITKPQDGATFYSPEQTITVEGKTDKAAQITVNDHIAIVNSDGSFSQKLRLESGDNPIKVIAQDKAGNQTEKELRVTYSQ